MSAVSSISSLVPFSLVIFSTTTAEGQKTQAKLERSIYETVDVATQSTVMERLNESRSPKILLVERPLGDGKTQAIIEEARREYPPSKLAIVCLLKKAELGMIPSLITAGISDYQPLPVTPDLLNARLSFCRKNISRELLLNEALVRDSLTGLPNRQHFLNQCKSHYASAKREQVSLTMTMIAPDHLGDINRRFGPAVGDSVLRGMAEILENRKRDTDLLCRYDGARFCILNVNMRETHLITYLDDLLASCQGQPFQAGQQKMWITASLGTTTYLGKDINDMIFQAEEGLFQSRENGHNQFTIQNEMVSEPVPVRSFN